MTGTYYLWDDVVNNGRIRITNTAANVGKAGQITGWINVSRIPGYTNTSAASTTYVVGDKVVVNGTIYGNGDGTGGSIKKTNATMYVVGLVSSKYKYHIGLAATKGGTRQGWAASSALSKQ